MRIIPVIDLKDGLVVHAAGGERQNYQPIKTPLSANADLVSVIDGFLSLYAFDIIYIADLDAIQGHGSHVELILHLRQEKPDLNLWIDVGIRTEIELEPFLISDLGTPVIGSETLQDISILGNRNVVLSLDYKGGQFLGAPKILKETQFWPQRIIIMSLDNVGSALGPNIDLLDRLKVSKPACSFYAAGGIRNAADLELLNQGGCAGALISTALHSNAINAEDLSRLSKIKNALR